MIIALIRLSFGAIFQGKAPYEAGFGPARVIFSHLLTNQLFKICCWCLWKRRRTGVEPASRGFQDPHSTAELPASDQGAIFEDLQSNNWVAVCAFNKMRFITRPGFHRTNSCPESRRLLRGYRGNSEFAVRIFIRFQGTFSRVMSPVQIVIITVAIALLFVPLTRCISIVIRDFTEQSPVPTQAPF